MKELLENEFALANGRMAGSVPVIARQLPSARVGWADAAACAACSHFFKMNCDHVVLNLLSGGGVTLIEFEYFINGFRQMKGEKCDYILHDKGDKIVLSDFTCSRTEYLENHWRDGKTVVGKRTKVRSQIEESIRKPYAVPTIAAHIDGYKEKIGLLGYRLRDEELSSNLPATLARRQKAFMGEFDALGKRKIALPMPRGFFFVENKYPDIYQW